MGISTISTEEVYPDKTETEIPFFIVKHKKGSIFIFLFEDSFGYLKLSFFTSFIGKWGYGFGCNYQQVVGMIEVGLTQFIDFDIVICDFLFVFKKIGIVFMFWSKGAQFLPEKMGKGFGGKV